MSAPRYHFRSSLAWLGIWGTLAVRVLAQTPSATTDVRLTGQPWEDMNYGPYLTASLEVSPTNLAYKGLAIRLDSGEGGVSKGSAFFLFDTDTLRAAAGWSGESFIDWRSIVYDGSHQTHPSTRGEITFENPVGPGWGKPADADFTEPRLRGRDGRPYGPLPRDWAHWRGLYVHGKQVILSYLVGETPVLESPGWEQAAGVSVWTRTLNLGPRREPMVLQVAHDADLRCEILADQPRPATAGPLAVLVPASSAPTGIDSRSDPSSSGVVFDGQTMVQINSHPDFNLATADYTIYARVKTSQGGTLFAEAPRAGDWAPNGKTFFIRGGKLSFDIGWVGVVTSRRKVNDDAWHDVALTYESASARIRLFIDGQLDGEGILRPKGPLPDRVFRLGFTSPNFPEDSKPYFEGDIAEVRFFQRALGAADIAALPTAQASREALLGHWNLERVETEDDVKDQSGHAHHATMHRGAAPVGRDGLIAAAFMAGPQGTEWIRSADGNLRLKIPAGAEAVRIKLLLARLPDRAGIESFSTLVSQSPAAANLEPLTHGGPRQWTEDMKTTQATIGRRTGPYVIEAITEPAENPYRSWMRMGGFDFFADGDRAAVCTWMGDVWIVEGLSSQAKQFTWRRIAAGMFQPLGLKIVDDTIYVTCRDQITRLHDLNGDGEIDFYENFNNDAQVTDHFHEFAMDLQTDAQGNFYYAKGARHALDALVPQHGTLIKVCRDGQRSEILAGGFRAPNGVCVNDDGTFFVSDQEGHWTPKNRINWVRRGGFYGNMWAYHEPREVEDFDPPVTWIHNAFDRSPAEQLWVTSDRWGPVQSSLINLSYGTGQISLVLHEKVGDVMQGGVVRLPIDDFPTGIMRGRFHPGDGQLYVCGLFGWAGNKTRPGGFYRVRYTGKPVVVPVQLHAKKTGLVIGFSEALDPDTASDSGSYAVSRFAYRRTANYGSKDYKISDPTQEGRDEVTVTAAELSADRKSVLLRIPDMRPAMQMEIKYRLRSASGARLSDLIQNTVLVLED